MNGNPFDFAGKVALVTGGSRGIGRATARLFAQNGAQVVIADTDLAGMKTASEIKEAGGEAIFVRTDVREADEIEALIAAAVETFGALHFAFNNAGILPATAPLADLEDDAFNDVLAVDLKGVFFCMKHEIRQMLRNGGGAIVNNASIAGLVADPGISAYVAAKHGVIGLSKAAAIEYANQGIRINALAPGLVETSMTKAWFDDPEIRSYFVTNSPIGRVGQPEEIAGMVLFLCSDLGSFAAGQTFVLDGGYTAR